jgi:uncharacterized protein
MPSQASFHPWDTSQKPELNALSRIDVIFHLAGEPIAQHWSDDVKRRIYDSRVDGTRRLVAAIRELKHKPYALISASAVGYYGDRGGEILTEAAPAGHDFLAEVCRDWEREAAHARDLGLRVVPIRIATVLGRGGGALKQMLPVFRFGIGGKFGSGKQWMSWIHVNDLVRLFLFAADNSAATAVLNGSSPNPVTNAEFTKALGRVLRRPTIVSVPKFALRAALGEMANFLYTSQRVLPEAAQRSGFAFEYPTVDEALRSAV